MPRIPVRLVLATVVSALVLGLAPATAQAATVPRVYGVSRAGQDWPNGRLVVKWRAVRSATYQMRVAASTGTLAQSVPVPTRTAAGTRTGVLDRGRTWFVQVRAIRSGRTGPWSTARGLTFQNAWPARPTSFRAASDPSREGRVRFDWGYTPYVSHYRPTPNAAWFGNWPGAAPGAATTWLPASARSATYDVPATPAPGDQLLAVDYANPVYARLEATNQYHPQRPVSRSASWVPAFPTPPTPSAGDPVRMGTYNVQLHPEGTRARLVARNIAEHGADVVALQEANVASGQAISAALGGSWSRAQNDDRGIGQQVVYRNDVYRAVGQGSFAVDSGGRSLVTPWVRLEHRNPQQPGRQQSFLVVSVHLAATPGASRVQENQDTGRAARQILAALSRVNPGGSPVLLAGDLRYGREPFGEAAATLPAQPVLVRGGFYDTMAATTRVGVQYSTLNAVDGTNRASQPAHPAGVAARSDHILVQGFRGATRYRNVHSWSSNGANSGVPSDHNLVLADLMVPFAG